LELPGPEQPECNSELEEYGSGVSSRYHFFVRNIIKGEEDGKYQSKAEI
jgi:hypothetical protein